MLNDHRYVFILTYGRSGSTLLSRLLNAHEGVLIRGENDNAALSLMNLVGAVDGLTARGTGGDSDGPHLPWYGAASVDAGGFARQTMDAFVRHVLRPTPSTRVLGFKEIRNTVSHIPSPAFEAYVQRLLYWFPDARIVFNSRDAAAVASSGWWRRRPVASVTGLIRDSDERFAKIAAENDRVIHVRHDDTVNGPASRAQLFEFLEIKLDESLARDVLASRLSHGKRAG